MVKYLNSFDRKSCNICGVGFIDGKEFEFYLDGDEPGINVDVHKHWIADNEEAWDGEKSKLVKTFEDAVEYINKLFNDEIRAMKPIGFDNNKKSN